MAKKFPDSTLYTFLYILQSYRQWQDVNFIPDGLTERSRKESDLVNATARKWAPLLVNPTIRQLPVQESYDLIEDAYQTSILLENNVRFFL